MTTRPATDHDWPQGAVAALLAGLKSTTANDQKATETRLLGGAA